MEWTEERTAHAKRLWHDGLSASQIAAEVGGISRNAVIGKMHRMKEYRQHHGPKVERYMPSGTNRKTYKSPRLPARPSALKAVLSTKTSDTETPGQLTPTMTYAQFVSGKDCCNILTDQAPFSLSRVMVCGRKTVPGTVYCEACCKANYNTPDLTKPKHYWNVNSPGRPLKGPIGAVIKADIKAHESAEEFTS